MMFRRMATFALIAGALTSQMAFAAPSHGKAHHCRNEKGQFAKCEKPKAKPCRDKSGKFAKCSTQDAQPASKAADAVKDSTNPMKSDMPTAPAASAPAAAATH
ncbi:hypothetical protein NQF87_06630 [Bombella sp. TMW 2.2559]|uniref:Uncharacterized protein n=1 Tax=Bombella dulcis TaxID=2967339 RepID=A0ABT3WCP4_9PROT|nr:hypothetical protein [Bombella dulcis]MCX5616643.1 hypothetical protein [Bombella dulcis]